MVDEYIIIDKIDQAIYESEKEMLEGGESIDLDEAFDTLNRKYQRRIV